jgi:flagella basal body P-ring formation protein FlgA
MKGSPPNCRRSGLSRVAARRVATLSAAALLAWCTGLRTWGADWQDSSELERLARTAALANLPRLGDQQRLDVGPVALGQKLPRCSAAITPSVAPGLKMNGRVVIELRCSDAKGWHVYVPVKVVGTASVAVAAHALIAGTVVTARDLEVERRDLTALPPGYLDDPSIAVGLTLIRALPGGAVLTNQELEGPKAVQRGQSVTLVASMSGIAVRMAGRALSDGLINQRVKVENLSSGKIVEGIARSDQVVEIVLE